jgi:hypothetical protein
MLALLVITEALITRPTFYLTSAAFVGVVDTNVDGVVEISAKLLGLLLCQGISCNH